MFQFSFLEIILYLVVILALLILKPLFQILLMKIKYGKKMYMIYFPLLGRGRQFQNQIQKYNDLYHFEKMIPQENPEVEMIVSNSFMGLTHVFLKPDHIKFILQNQDLYKKATKVFLFGDKMFYKGLVFQEGDEWKLARNVLSKSFEFDQLRARIPLIKRLCEEKFQSVQENEPINIINISGNIVGEVITQSFFSQSFKDLNGKTFLSELVNVLVSIISQYREAPYRCISRAFIFGESDYPDWTLSSVEKQLLARLQNIKEILRVSIKERQQMQNKPADFLTAYINTIQQNPNLTEEHAIQQYIMLIFAGIDTTSHLFGACCYALSIHPEWQKKLREEIQKQYGTYEQLNNENINISSFITNFINECMRMYTPVPYFVEREVKQDHKVGEYFLKKNSQVQLCILPNNYDVKNFSDPFKFNPDRWNKQIIDPFIFLPFSTGKRNCIGQHMALMEVKCLLIYLLMNFEVSLSGEKQVWSMKFVYTIQDDKFIQLKRIAK
ncbi:unnamed protein product [Paramecium pentaurelia]|uniref:Cytochrome P450 n=1 Tax=Paramecium pentaurelia TaxID=43138 RepID=A0A8S1WIT5_9CILI|nr:unnamed protein product [Paramecium pentaurelia]